MNKEAPATTARKEPGGESASMPQAGYAPVSRRPIAGVFRRTADGAAHFCARTGIHPDVISYLSIVAAAAAGLCFWQSGRWRNLLLIAPLLCYVRLWFNMLDGMVALASGKASGRISSPDLIT